MEKIRYLIFWFIDFIKGRKIKTHYNNISLILNQYSTPQSKLKREYNLNTLLQHAVNTTIFYKNQKGNSGINSFPVINKNSIRDNSNQFKSIDFITKKNTSVSTSGSTGAILKLLWNKNKKNRNTADAIYFSELAGFKIGYKLLYLRHWNKFYKKSKLEAFIKNIIPIEVLDINNEYLSKLITKIKKDTTNQGWLGYASGFELICKYLDKENAAPINLNIKSIITMSEGLNPYTKNAMKKYFNITPLSRYSNMENGIIAQQAPNSNSNFKINWASYYVEILNFNEDVPAKPNELGRIVITDLFNYCMPIIRYDTGDVGSIDYNASPPTFNKIEGRKTDIILNTKGGIVSSFIMMNTYNYSGIKQTQLIQEEKTKYILKMNVSKSFNQETEIVKEFKNYLGKDATIKVEYVTEIPLLISGKRKITLNNYIKN